MLGTEKEKDFIFNLNPQGLALKKTEEGSFMLIMALDSIKMKLYYFLTSHFGGFIGLIQLTLDTEQCSGGEFLWC